MGPIIILLVIIYLCSRKSDKNKKRHRHYSGKSAWERECDDGAKFFGWYNSNSAYHKS